MTFLQLVNTQEVRSDTRTSPGSTSYDEGCTICPPGPDLMVYKHMFTINGEADNTKEELPDGFTIPSYPDDRYGIRSTFTAYKNCVSHLGTAVTGPSGQLRGSVQAEPTAVEEIYPIKDDSFSWVPIDEPGQWSLKVGPFEFHLKGNAYEPMKGWGMNVGEFAHSEWDKGKMYIVGVKVSEGHVDPRPKMTEKSLNTAYAGSVASCPSANGTSVSEK